MIYFIQIVIIKYYGMFMNIHFGELEAIQNNSPITIEFYGLFLLLYP
ncbi:MAG TPA: hypothetical protein VF338_06240 [Leptolinea sp.]